MRNWLNRPAEISVKAAALFLSPLLALMLVAAVFPIRSTRTVTVQTVGTGVAQVCAVSPDAPSEPLACIDVNPAESDVIVSFDVTARLQPGQRTCFQAIAISPEGLQSEPSDDQACGTVPAKPLIR